MERHVADRSDVAPEEPKSDATKSVAQGQESGSAGAGEARYFGGMTAKEAGRLGGEAAKRKRLEQERRLAALGQGPREVIARVLIEEREALAETVRTLLRAGSGGDLRAAQTLVRYLDQGLGKVEQNPAGGSSEDAPLSQLTKEERAGLRAWLQDQPSTEA